MIKDFYYRLSRKIRYYSGDLLHITGLSKSILKKARGKKIIVYHGVCQNHPLKFNTLFVTQKVFEEHLKYYKRYFNIVSLADYFNEAYDLQRFNICITFDDGFANNYKYVLPLLEKYKIPATFFITAISNTPYNVLWNDFLSIAEQYGPKKITLKNTVYTRNKRKYTNPEGIVIDAKLHKSGFEDKARFMSVIDPEYLFDPDHVHADYWLQMTPEQIKALSASPYVTIGAHGYYHNNLAEIPLPDAVNEMVNTKKYLEDITGKTVNSIAFPYGAYNAEVLAAARQSGHEHLLATDLLNSEVEGDFQLRERVTINPFISVPNQIFDIIKFS